MRDTKRWLTFLAVLAVLGAWSFGRALPVAAQESEPETPAAEEVVLEGEVIDLTCYFNHPEEAQGPEHASCAQQCAQRGLPVGLLVRAEGDGPTDGTLYMALGQDHGDASTMLAAHAGSVIRVRGYVKQQNGMQAIEISEVVVE